MSPVLQQKTVGAHVRRLRKAARLSLRAFAEATGFSPSFISQLENGQVSPSIHSMEKIATALGATLGGFFAELQPEEPAPIVRARDRRSARSAWSRARVEPVGPFPAESGFESLVLTLLPGGRSGKHPAAQSRRQLVFVLEGRATLFLGEREHRLSAGDAAVLRAHEPHLWTNAGTERCRLLLVGRSD